MGINLMTKPKMTKEDLKKIDQWESEGKSKVWIYRKFGYSNYAPYDRRVEQLRSEK